MEVFLAAALALAPGEWIAHHSTKAGILLDKADREQIHEPAPADTEHRRSSD